MGSPEPLCARCNERKDAGVHDTVETCEEVRGPCLDPARHHPFVARSGDTTRTAVARDVLARAILEGSGQSQIARRPDDGFEWYGAANDLADAILAALAGSAYTLAPSSESVTPASEVEPGLRCDFDCDACRQSCDEPSGLCQLERGHSGAHDMTAAVPAVTPRTEDEFRERACPSCGEVLAPADTHWDLMADRYLCAVPAVTPASTETLRAARVAELEEALADMVNQFAYWSDGEVPGQVTGGLSALEGAFEALGYDEPHIAEHLRCDEPGCHKANSSGWPSPTGYRHTCHEHTDYHQQRRCNYPPDDHHFDGVRRALAADGGRE